MAISQFGHHASARGPFDESFHNQEGFVYLLHRAGILADGGGDGRQPYGAATELVDDSQQNLVVYLVESVLVYVQGSQRNLCNLRVYTSIALHLGKVAHSAQQGVGDTGRTSATAGNLQGCVLGDGNAQYIATTLYNALQRLGLVVLQVHVDAEAGT